MSCPHTETTAILAAFGEAPPEFEEHLQQCIECHSVVREHTSTLAALEPLLEQPPSPKTNTRWSAPSISFLVAASLLLGFQFVDNRPVETAVHTDEPIPVSVEQPDVSLFDDQIDEKLAALELQIDLFHLEES